MVALSVAGCATTSLPGRGAGVGKGFPRGPQAPIPTATSLVTSAAARDAALAAFRGQARLTYEGPDGNFKSSQMIVVRAPNNMRIDIMGPFGPSYTVASDGRMLTAYDRGEKIVYTGSATDEHVARYTRVALSIPTLVALLRGLPPVPAYSQASVSRRSDGWGLALVLADGGTMETVFDFDTRAPKTVKLSGSHLGSQVEAVFGDFRNVGGLSTPHSVEVIIDNGSRARLQYDKIWRDVSISDSAFIIKAASGVRHVDMDEQI
jgi:outer membrane lipoprotein-sorting protein